MPARFRDNEIIPSNPPFLKGDGGILNANSYERLAMIRSRKPTAYVEDLHETCRQQVLREHAVLARDIQEASGCSLVDARMQAWIRLFEQALQCTSAVQ
jgi:hypothetical protein